MYYSYTGGIYYRTVLLLYLYCTALTLHSYFDSPKTIDFADIKEATGNWDPANRIGSGGSCVVFSGTLYGEWHAIW
jgi:hypothetical protein